MLKLNNKELISQYITIEMLNLIAKEHLKGRRLWIGTTNLDAGRPVIWDIGEIALSGKPKALDLVHNIMLHNTMRYASHTYSDPSS